MGWNENSTLFFCFSDIFFISLQKDVKMSRKKKETTTIEYPWSKYIFFII